jgi:L-lactate utilization protein LutC
MMKVSASDLNVIVKHCNKNIVKRLKSRTIIQIVAEMNTFIDRMKNELREIANAISNNSSTNQVLTFQHLRNENLKLFVRKKKNVRFLCQHFCGFIETRDIRRSIDDYVNAWVDDELIFYLWVI